MPSHLGLGVGEHTAVTEDWTVRSDAVTDPKKHDRLPTAKGSRLSGPGEGEDAGDAAVVAGRLELHPRRSVELGSRVGDRTDEKDRPTSRAKLKVRCVGRCEGKDLLGRPDLRLREANEPAFVELQQGAEATREEIMEHTNSQIAHYKKVREVVFVDQIPVSGAGKVLKKELRERLKKE